MDIEFLTKVAHCKKLLKGSSMTAICLTAPPIIGAGDNQTKAKETGTDVESTSSATRNGKQRRRNGKQLKEMADRTCQRTAGMHLGEMANERTSSPCVRTKTEKGFLSSTPRMWATNVGRHRSWTRNKKAMVLSALEVAKNRGSDSCDVGHEKKIITRSQVRLDLWAIHLKSPIAALAKALESLEQGERVASATSVLVSSEVVAHLPLPSA